MLVNIGICYSLYKPIVNGQAPFNSVNPPISESFFTTPSYGGGMVVSTSPAYHIGVEYFLTSNNLIGIEICFQSWGTEYPFSGSLFGYTTSGNASRLNTAVSYIRNIYLDESTDCYYSVKGGISYWTGTKDIPASANNGPQIEHFNAIYPAFQFIVGLRKRVLPVLFIHLELGIGSPYALEGGLTLALGKKIR